MMTFYPKLRIVGTELMAEENMNCYSVGPEEICGETTSTLIQFHRFWGYFYPSIYFPFTVLSAYWHKS